MLKPVKYIDHESLSREHALGMGYTMFIPSLNGWAYYAKVAYYMDYPLNRQMKCSFCLGDPFDYEGKETNINYYYQHTPGATTCPICKATIIKTTT